MKKKRVNIQRMIAIFVVLLSVFQVMSIFSGDSERVYAEHPLDGFEKKNYIHLVSNITRDDCVGDFYGKNAPVRARGGNKPVEADWEIKGYLKLINLPEKLKELAIKGDLRFRFSADLWLDENDTFHCNVGSSHTKEDGNGKNRLISYRSPEKILSNQYPVYSLYFKVVNGNRNWSQLRNSKIKFYDVVGPKITSIEVDSQRRYKNGDIITFSIKFDEDVRFKEESNKPGIAMNTSSANNMRFATYISGNETNTILFQYVVGENDLTRNDMPVGGRNQAEALKFNGNIEDIVAGFITDIAGNSVLRTGRDQTLFNQFESESVQIDGISPEVKNFKKEIYRSNVIKNDGYMKYGDVLRLKFVLDESVQVNSNTIPLNNNRQAVYESGNGTSTVTYKYVVGNNENINKLSIKDGFRIDQIGMHDDYGNGARVQNGTNIYLDYNGSNVFVDTVSPNASFQTNGNSEYRKKHETTVRVIEDGSGLKNDQFKYQWTQSDIFPVNWNSANIIVPGALISKEAVSGDWYLHILLEDRSGNIFKSTSNVFKLDNEKPSYSVLPDGSDISEDGRHIYFGDLTPDVSPYDTHSGIKSVKYQWVSISESELSEQNWKDVLGGKADNPNPATTGGYILHVKVEDKSKGEELEPNVKQGTAGKAFYLDRTPPEITMIENESLEFKRKRAVRVTAIDEHSDMARMAFYWSKSLVTQPSNDGKWVDLGQYHSLIRSNEWPEKMGGIWHLHILAIDKWGNESTKYMAFKFDNVAPEVEFNYPVVLTSVVKAGEVRVDVRDDNSITDLYYQWTQNKEEPEANDPSWVNFENGEVLKKENVSGEWYLHIKAKDIYKNQAIVASRKIIIDNTRPNAGNYEIISNYHFNQRDAIIEIKADEFERVNYYIEDWNHNPIKNGIMKSEKINVLLKLPDVEGEYKYFFSFEDELGNLSDKIEKTFTYDTTPPEADLVYSKSQSTKDDVTVSINNIRDNYTQQDEVITPRGSEKIFTENGQYTFKIVDKAGNIKMLAATVDYIDKLAPSIRIVPITSEEISSVSLKSLSTESEESSKIPVVKGKARVEVHDNITTDNEIEIFYQWNNGENTPNSEDSNWISTSNNSVLINDNPQGGVNFLYIKAIDGVGNVNIKKSSEFVVDNVAPVGEITYSTAKDTANIIVATITFDEPGVKITKPESGLNYYEFEENGSFVFEFEDSVGNKGTATAEVNNIDDTLPKAEVLFSTKDLTRDNVRVTVSVKNLPGYYLADFSFDNEMNENLISKEIRETETESTEPESTEPESTEPEITEPESEKVIEVVYEVSGNGNVRFTLKSEDESKEDQDVVVQVNNIAKTLGGVKVTYSERNWTRENVIAKIISSNVNPIEITNNGGKNTFLFTENGEFEFTYRDLAGNESTITARVENIDKEAPTATTELSETERTNENVVVTITPVDNSGEPVVILNNRGANTYTFEENGAFIFKLQDVAGNICDYQVEVNNIDTEKPQAYITYNPTEETNTDVTARINFTNLIQEPVTITNNFGLDEYVFTQNGIFTFEFVDGAGNAGKLKAVVDWIDKEAPIAAIQPSETNPTPENIKLKLIAEKGTIILNNESSDTIIAEENGVYSFEISDKLGNKRVVSYEVTNIDREAPDVRVYYSTKELTNKDVIVTIASDEEINIFNSDSKEYVFKDNGEVTFRVSDIAGNEVLVLAKVENIDKTAPQLEINYSTKELARTVKVTLISNEEIRVLNNEGSKEYTFDKNGYYSFYVEDIAGNRARAVARVNNIDYIPPVIEFENKYLVYQQGEEPLLNDFRAFDNRDGLITEKVVIDRSGLDMNKAGDQKVIYTVSDRAGNIVREERTVKVLSVNDLMVFVNGEYNDEDEYIIYGSNVELKIFGFVERYTIRHRKGGGKLKSGDMKLGYGLIDNRNNSRIIKYEADKSGWHTFYIQGLNRKTKKINVFFSESN